MSRWDVFRVGLNGETAIPRAEIDNPPSERLRAGLEAMLFAFRNSTILWRRIVSEKLVFGNSIPRQAVSVNKSPFWLQWPERQAGLPGPR